MEMDITDELSNQQLGEALQIRKIIQSSPTDAFLNNTFNLPNFGNFQMAPTSHLPITSTPPPLVDTIKLRTSKDNFSTKEKFSTIKSDVERKDKSIGNPINIDSIFPSQQNLRSRDQTITEKDTEQNRTSAELEKRKQLAQSKDFTYLKELKDSEFQMQNIPLPPTTDKNDMMNKIYLRNKMKLSKISKILVPRLINKEVKMTANTLKEIEALANQTSPTAPEMQILSKINAIINRNQGQKVPQSFRSLKKQNKLFSNEKLKKIQRELHNTESELPEKSTRHHEKSPGRSERPEEEINARSSVEGQTLRMKPKVKQLKSRDTHSTTSPAPGKNVSPRNPPPINTNLEKEAHFADDLVLKKNLSPSHIHYNYVEELKRRQMKKGALSEQVPTLQNEDDYTEKDPIQIRKLQKLHNLRTDIIAKKRSAIVNLEKIQKNIKRIENINPPLLSTMNQRKSRLLDQAEKDYKIVEASNLLSSNNNIRSRSENLVGRNSQVGIRTKKAANYIKSELNSSLVKIGGKDRNYRKKSSTSPYSRTTPEKLPTIQKNKFNFEFFKKMPVNVYKGSDPHSFSNIISPQILSSKEITLRQAEGNSRKPSPAPSIERWITFLECGSDVYICKSFALNIQTLFDKYDVFDEQIKRIRKEQNDFTDLQSNKNIQMHALNELLEICNEKLGNKAKNYKHIFLINGTEVTQLSQIPPNCQVLIVAETSIFSPIENFDFHEEESKKNILIDSALTKKTYVDCQDQWFEDKWNEWINQDSKICKSNKQSTIEEYYQPSNFCYSTVDLKEKKKNIRTSNSPMLKIEERNSYEKKHAKKRSASITKVPNEKNRNGKYFNKLGEILAQHKKESAKDLGRHSMNKKTSNSHIPKLNDSQNMEKSCDPFFTTHTELQGKSSRANKNNEINNFYDDFLNSKNHFLNSKNHTNKSMMEENQERSLENTFAKRPSANVTFRDIDVDITLARIDPYDQNEPKSTLAIKKFSKKKLFKSPNTRLIKGKNAIMSHNYDEQLKQNNSHTNINGKRLTFIRAGSSLVEGKGKMLSELHELRNKYRLTDNVMFQLRSEFISLKRIDDVEKEKKQLELRTTKEIERKHNRISLNVTPNPTMINPLHQTVSFEIINIYTNLFKDKHPDMIGRFVHAIGVDYDDPDVTFAWEDYVRINAFLKYCSCTLPDTINFWIKVLDPRSVEIIPNIHYMDCFEKLARGFFNKEETIVSRSYADRMEQILEKNNCLIENKQLKISLLRQCLLNKEIDINAFNSTLKFDARNQFI